MRWISDFAVSWLDWTVAASWQIAVLVCLIAVITFLCQRTSPKLRYGLWLLVLLKAMLPPTLAAAWGVGALWQFSPLTDGMASAVAIDTAPSLTALTNLDESHASGPVPTPDESFGLVQQLLVLWGAGCLFLWAVIGWRYQRFAKTIDALQRIDEGPVRIELERLATRFQVRRVPELYTTDKLISPMLFGIVRPRIVLPTAIITRLDRDELQIVLAHELTHWRRLDTWIGLLQVLVQGLFWFHPLVWFANARIRFERECVCDETVLRGVSCDRDGYGETLLRVLTAARGQSLVVANMVGIFERGSHLETRLEEIMRFDPKQRRFGWLSRAALVAAAFVLIPMAAPAVDAEPQQATAPTKESSIEEEQHDSKQAARPKTNWPVIVSTVPEIGAADVDPQLKEIMVTFDRDMNVGGYSWTGAGPYLPKSPEGTNPVWVDARTCVYPVELKKGSFYRIGINSSDFQNFRSALGVPAPTTAIYFATEGASRAVLRRLQVPQVVELRPEDGATEVDPKTSMLRVTFDMPMDTGGYSWTGGGPTFPKIPNGKKPRWSRNAKTCMLPVKLAAGTTYEVGLNSFGHKNFASKWGVPIDPVTYSFSTAGKADARAMDPNAPPTIVQMVPENGATDVDPALRSITVTFDRPMAGGFSWTGGGENFPTIPDGKRPKWSEDKMTCTLPVKLKPNWSYQLGLNSPSHRNFASANGVALEPVVYTFQTSPGSE